MLGLSFPSIVNNSCTSVLYTTVHNSHLYTTWRWPGLSFGNATCTIFCCSMQHTLTAKPTNIPEFGSYYPLMRNGGP